MPVLFDLDGTLLDTAPDFAHVLNQMRAEHQLPPLSLEAIKPAVSEGLAALIQLAFNLPTEHSQHGYLSEQFLKRYETNPCRFTKPFPGILALLANLEQHAIPWGIVTNKKKALTESILKTLQFIDRASCIVCGDSTPYLKPHPASLLFACKALNVPPAHCVYIGDAERDIQAGHSAGMTTIGALFGYITTIEEAFQWNADYYVNTANDIYPWIQQWYKK